MYEDNIYNSYNKCMWDIRIYKIIYISTHSSCRAYHILVLFFVDLHSVNVIYSVALFIIVNFKRMAIYFLR
jgi:hypothetical protein